MPIVHIVQGNLGSPSLLQLGKLMHRKALEGQPVKQKVRFARC